MFLFVCRIDVLFFFGSEETAADTLHPVRPILDVDARRPFAIQQNRRVAFRMTDADMPRLSDEVGRPVLRMFYLYLARRRISE